MSKTIALKTLKDTEEQQIAFAEVYAPGLPDSDGEFMDEDTIRKMAYDFMHDLGLKNIDVGHNNEKQDACVVESFIARKGDPDFLAGSWVVGVHIADPELWGKVKKGEINGFSIEAMVVKEPHILEMDIPPVISGTTSKADDGHEHQFFVTYDVNGNLVGGKTSSVNGHYHEIKRGTATELTSGHNHRFSFLDWLIDGRTI